ncbi:YveK family protein [Alkalicoccus halolimnae]|uniref:Wzz/FepE/Etk N-terminal domain-containing protein n=1 Tax=Alkalicoccus halolimnae TaxID=1667239 RepID=A0A5C7FNC4_9BACI|nr:Wzz/FepE/Etk N-terminal domain-containing protein [Alkalicoccus halolimnae]TXF87509.1 capsular biosynthesis protein [Alkalicoccus halolimnae]
MKSPIDFLEILSILKRRIRLIVLMTFSITAAAGLMTYYLVTPMYEASTQILVNQPPSEGEAFSSRELETSRELIETYNTIITSSRILDPTLQQLGLEQSRSELSSQITVRGEGESQVLRITVEDSNQAEAADIANTLASVFQEEVPQIMNINNVSSLAEAEVEGNPSPISPNIGLNMGAAFIVTLGLGIGITMFLELLDNTIKSEADIENELNISVLGQVSTVNVENRPDLEVLSSAEKSQGSETYGA